MHPDFETTIGEQKMHLIHRRIRYVKTWERGRVNDFDQYEQLSHVYNEGFFPNYIIMELQCSIIILISVQLNKLGKHGIMNEDFYHVHKLKYCNVNISRVIISNSQSESRHLNKLSFH